MTPCMIALLALTASAPRPKTQAQSPVGKWEVLAWSYSGQSNSVEEGTFHEYTSSGKRLVTEPGMPEQAERTYERRPADGPRAIDLYRSDGNGGADHYKAIFKIEGDIMWLCIGTKDDRPTTFESPKGKPIHLYKFRRASRKD